MRASDLALRGQRAEHAACRRSYLAQLGPVAARVQPVLPRIEVHEQNGDTAEGLAVWLRRHFFLTWLLCWVASRYLTTIQGGGRRRAGARAGRTDTHRGATSAPRKPSGSTDKSRPLGKTDSANRGAAGASESASVRPLQGPTSLLRCPALLLPLPACTAPQSPRPEARASRARPSRPPCPLYSPHPRAPKRWTMHACGRRIASLRTCFTSGQGTAR
jgi:hypothetical protein